MPLRVRPEADDAAWQIGCRYMVHDPTKGLKFGREWAAALGRIAADPTGLPEHHMATGPQVRYARITGFPYIILYRTTDPAETVVLDTLHVGSGPAAYRRAERRG